MQAVQAAEKGTLEGTFELLHRAFAEAPNHASPCNNRAQLSTHTVSEPDPSHWEEWSGHALTFQLSPGWNVDLTNQKR